MTPDRATRSLLEGAFGPGICDCAECGKPLDLGSLSSFCSHPCMDACHAKHYRPRTALERQVWDELDALMRERDK